MSIEEQTLKGLYEVKRDQIISAYLNPATRDYVPTALAYSYALRVYPIFHNTYELNDIFNGCYSVSKDQVKYIIDAIEEAGENYLSFYDLESLANAPARWELITILRYWWLHADYGKELDPKIFNTLLGNMQCPTEAHGLQRKFEINEISWHWH